MAVNLVSSLPCNICFLVALVAIASIILLYIFSIRRFYGYSFTGQHVVITGSSSTNNVRVSLFIIYYLKSSLSPCFQVVHLESAKQSLFKCVDISYETFVSYVAINVCWLLKSHTINMFIGPSTWCNGYVGGEKHGHVTSSAGTVRTFRTQW
jgi:hypothetical protein